AGQNREKLPKTPEYMRLWKDQATDTTPALNTQYIRAFQQWVPALLESGGYMAAYIQAFTPFLGALAKGNSITQLGIKQAAPYVSASRVTLIGRLEDIKAYLEDIGAMMDDFNILNDRNWDTKMQRQWEDDNLRLKPPVGQIGPGGHYTIQESTRFRRGGLRVTRIPRPR
ncbi:MAG TPA: hypothetical protein VN181_10210, partial [Thermoanaerobaculia bacterium]|nr:hypothetical protein [Thermoanaerobaculia bacterium]